MLHGFDRDGHVPVVRRPDEYRIDVRPCQHFAEITVPVQSLLPYL